MINYRTNRSWLGSVRSLNAVIVCCINQRQSKPALTIKHFDNNQRTKSAGHWIKSATLWIKYIKYMTETNKMQLDKPVWYCIDSKHILNKTGSDLSFQNSSFYSSISCLKLSHSVTHEGEKEQHYYWISPNKWFIRLFINTTCISNRICHPFSLRQRAKGNNLQRAAASLCWSRDLITSCISILQGNHVEGETVGVRHWAALCSFIVPSAGGQTAVLAFCVDHHQSCCRALTAHLSACPVVTKSRTQ